MDINSQHQNLLGNQISSKSEDFCILWFKMATIANQRWISIRNIIIYLETKFRPNRRIFVFAGNFIPWLPWQRPPFWICSTPQKLSHTTVDIPTKWIIIWLPNHGYQFPTSKSTWKPNFAQIWGFLYLAAILYFGYHGNGHHFELFQPPKSCHILRWIFLQSGS